MAENLSKIDTQGMSGPSDPNYDPKKDTREYKPMMVTPRRIHTPEFSTTRKLYPGYSDLTGLKDLGLLGKGLMEGEESNYKDEEDLLLEINNEVKSLITELEKKDDEA